MADTDLRDRIAKQFSYGHDRADIWRAFEVFLATDRYLNLGYSAWYQPHVLGSCQRRLVEHVGSLLAANLPRSRGVTLLDIGAGRGGPATQLADRFGFRVVGVDLVPYNVSRARRHGEAVDASFVVGDATTLPFRSRTMDAGTAIDSLVYLPEKNTVFAELSRVLDSGGVVVLSDLVREADISDRQRQAVNAFAAAWDMPPLVSMTEYTDALRECGFAVRTVSDITANSVGRFRTWTTLYRWLTGGSMAPLVDRLLRRSGLNPSAITLQIDRAHDALPSLRHITAVAEAL